jgi:hypothetical protein
MAISDAAAMLGRKGGSTKGGDKARASRENGKKGGRRWRYCEPCDAWGREKECKACGADTVIADKD